MKCIRADAVPARAVDEAGASAATVRELITGADGAPTFAMRLFELQPGGNTLYHSHAWEHEVYILSGTGLIAGPDGDTAFEPGCVVYLEPGRSHQFRNTGSEVVRFICCIPVAQVCANPGPLSR